MVALAGLSVAGAQAADVGNLYTERSRAALRQTKCDFSERHIVIANKMDKPLYVIVNYVIGDPVLIVFIIARNGETARSATLLANVRTRPNGSLAR